MLPLQVCTMPTATRALQQVHPTAPTAIRDLQCRLTACMRAAQVGLVQWLGALAQLAGLPMAWGRVAPALRVCATEMPEWDNKELQGSAAVCAEVNLGQAGPFLAARGHFHGCIARGTR